jgi:hypothetical protein
VSTVEPSLKVYNKRRPCKDAAPGEAPLTSTAEAFVSKISKSVGSLLECPIVQKRKPKKGTGCGVQASPGVSHHMPGACRGRRGLVPGSLVGVCLAVQKALIIASSNDIG